MEKDLVRERWFMTLTRKQQEMYKGYRGDRRCFACGWFGHLARNCCNCVSKPLFLFVTEHCFSIIFLFAYYFYYDY